MIGVSNLPKIYDVSATPSSTLEGGYINISCKIFDADGINDVFLRFRDPENNLHIIPITDNKTDNIYYSNKTYTIAGEYTYYIRANDTTNNYSRAFGQFYRLYCN